MSDTTDTTPNSDQCAEQASRLYKTTIVVWSDHDPTNRVEASALVQQAEAGDAYISRQTTVTVEQTVLGADPDTDDGLFGFFDIDENTSGEFLSPEDDCSDGCAVHRPDCDGYCDHLPGHRNGCWVLPNRVPREVRARVTADDQSRSVTFSAATFFAHASREALVALHRSDYRGEAADEVAYSMESTDEGVANLLTYAAAASNSGEDTGFEVEVNAVDALAWLAAHRADVLPLG